MTLFLLSPPSPPPQDLLVMGGSKQAPPPESGAVIRVCGVAGPNLLLAFSEYCPNRVEMRWREARDCCILEAGMINRVPFEMTTGDKTMSTTLGTQIYRM